jgi:hypothetical protein
MRTGITTFETWRRAARVVAVRGPALALTLLAVPACPLQAADRDALEKKLGLVSYYLDSATSTRIRNSDNQRAQQLLERAVALRDEARRALADGDLTLAEREIGLALRSISAASSALTQSRVPEDAVVTRNEELRGEIDGYRQSFNRTVIEKGPQFASLLDRARLDELLAKAAALTRAGDHAAAGERLREAYRLVVDAVTRLRNNETVVYALNFRTPADEYRYEEKRHQSYALLVHQMVSTGAAQGPRGQLVNRFLEDASRLAEQAREQAAGGDHATAIKSMEDANRNMVRALQMMGLSIPG